MSILSILENHILHVVKKSKKQNNNMITQIHTLAMAEGMNSRNTGSITSTQFYIHRTKCP